MKTSDKGLVALAMKEGLVPAPYLDSVGVWTYGVGHAETSGLAPNPRHMPKGMPADIQAATADALRLFKKDLAKYEAAVNRAVKVPVKQHEFDALVSFHYNTGGIAKAALTRHLNAGDRAKAAVGFMGWLKPPEIRGRREAEQRLFREGVYPAGNIPVYSVSTTGKLGGIIDRVPAHEALRLMDGGPKPRTSKAQSTTLQASAGQIVGGVGTAAGGVAMLDGTAQIVALAIGGAIILLALYIMRERLRKWAAGDR